VDLPFTLQTAWSQLFRDYIIISNKSEMIAGDWQLPRRADKIGDGSISYAMIREMSHTPAAAIAHGWYQPSRSARLLIQPE
jgi:hypothetical protein